MTRRPTGAERRLVLGHRPDDTHRDQWRLLGLGAEVAEVPREILLPGPLREIFGMDIAVHDIAGHRTGVYHV